MIRCVSCEKTFYNNWKWAQFKCNSLKAGMIGREGISLFHQWNILYHWVLTCSSFRNVQWRTWVKITLRVKRSATCLTSSWNRKTLTYTTNSIEYSTFVNNKFLRRLEDLRRWTDLCQSCLCLSIQINRTFKQSSLNYWRNKFTRNWRNWKCKSSQHESFEWRREEQ